VEKFTEWTDSSGCAIDRDRILTNVMLYWLSATAGSSARLYKESAGSFGEVQASAVPTGMAVFAHDITLPVRTYSERMDNIVRWSEFPRGGHFPALEQPDLLLGDIRAFFRALTDG